MADPIHAQSTHNRPERYLQRSFHFCESTTNIAIGIDKAMKSLAPSQCGDHLDPQFCDDHLGSYLDL